MSHDPRLDILDAAGELCPNRLADPTGASSRPPNWRLRPARLGSALFDSG